MNATNSPLPITDTLSPASAGDLAAAVCDAFSSGTPVYPLGGGTSLDYGLPPRRPGIGLSLTGLNRVVDYPARDMTITVEAGVTLHDLAATLAGERQRLPIDAPQAGQATLGGLIATNFSGPRRFGCGTVRDYVIGISAVDGRGTPFKGGGRVVKNVAGYDFCKLLTGSLGTLGVITQVTLKLKPIPEASAWVCTSLPNLEAAERLLASLVTSRTSPAAVELLAGPGWQSDPTLGSLAALGFAVLAVGLEGTSAETDWMVSQLAAEWRELGAAHTEVLHDQPAGGLWERLTQFPAADRAAPVLRAAVLPGKLTGFIGQLLAADTKCTLQAHAANGIIIARLAGVPAADVAKLLIHRLQPAAAAAGGSLVVLSAPEGVESTRQTVWGGATGDLGLMRSVKEQFDPKGILNPGRFVYG